jgi:hypothetical protein
MIKMKHKKIIIISIFFALAVILLLSYITSSKIDTRIVYEDTSLADNSKKIVEGHIGYEIIEIESINSLRAWITTNITKKEFEELDLPIGWFKNQARETDPDSARFFQSPNTKSNGEFLEGSAFGHNWRHVATIIKPRVDIDSQGLLSGSLVKKYHEVTFNQGKEVYLLVSPKEEYYIRITRDANRISDNPTIPKDWKLIKKTLSQDITIMLPEETTVIRADNEDSFQGPITIFE